MKIKLLSVIAMGFFALTACDNAGQEGAECMTDDDCAEGFECHDHEGVMECEAHEEGDEPEESAELEEGAAHTDE